MFVKMAQLSVPNVRLPYRSEPLGSQTSTSDIETARSVETIKQRREKRILVRNRILLYVTPWGHTFLTALIISGVTFDGHFPLAFTSPSVLHPYVCVAITYIPGHTHLGVTQEVSLTL